MHILCKFSATVLPPKHQHFDWLSTGCLNKLVQSLMCHQDGVVHTIQSSFKLILCVSVYVCLLLPKKACQRAMIQITQSTWATWLNTSVLQETCQPV